MATCWLLHLPDLKRAMIDERVLAEDFKAKACPHGAGCKQGPAKCPFLHPGEKGRRDLRRFLYSETPCPRYSLDGGACPEGDGCPFALGFLERRFHPSRYSRKVLHSLDLEEYLKREDILDEDLKEKGLLHPHHDADASERAAIELILHLNGTDLICGSEPYAVRPVVTARTATHAIHKHYPGTESVTGATLAYENASTWKKNVQPTLAPASDDFLFNSFYNGSNKLLLKHNKDIAVTPFEERVEQIGAQLQILSAVDAPLTTGGSSVPEGPNRGRVQCPIYFDSGASVHVVGDEWMLQGYQVLAEPWPITVADDHPLVVVGIGFISQEGFMIPNVFHVQGLKMNLISVSQLDRDHGLFSGFHDGICKVLKSGGDVVGGGFLLANGLYALSFLQVPETETPQAPETETGEEAAGSAIQAM